MADAVADSILVRAERSVVLDVVADLAAYPQWQEECREVQVLETDARGRDRTARFVVDARIIQVTMVLAYTYEPPDAPTAVRWTLVEGDGVRRVDGSYELEERGGGTTAVTYRVAVEPSMSLPGFVRRRAAKLVVDRGLKGLKARVESRA